MSRANGNLAAFARPWVTALGGQSEPQKGLTKRELFAAMAMQGMLGNTDHDGNFEVYADDAVKHADALLAALDAKPEAK